MKFNVQEYIEDEGQQATLDLLQRWQLVLEDLAMAGFGAMTIEETWSAVNALILIALRNKEHNDE